MDIAEAPTIIEVALYRYFDVDGRLLYVGITEDPLARHNAHKATAAWWSSVDHARTRYEWFTDREDARRAELSTIRSEHPIWNKQGKRTGRRPKIAVTGGEHLADTYRLWPDPEVGPWFMTFHWQSLNGRAECIGVGIISSIPRDSLRDTSPIAEALPEIGQPLRAITLREIKVAELVFDERLNADHLSIPAAVRPVVETPPTALRSATYGKLQLVADVYEKARADGRVPPNQAVADKLKISIGAAANLASRARKAGLLPPAE